MPSSPNPGKDIPDGARKQKRGPKQLPILTNENVRKVANQRHASLANAVYKRNMEEKIVRRELFLIEYEDCFDLKSHKSKMSEVIQRSSDELKEFFYDNGVKGNLPENWLDFKE